MLHTSLLEFGSLLSANTYPRAPLTKTAGYHNMRGLGLPYHLALACGTDPDEFRADDPRFARVMNVSGRL